MNLKLWGYWSGPDDITPSAVAMKIMIEDCGKRMLTIYYVKRFMRGQVIHTHGFSPTLLFALVLSLHFFFCLLRMNMSVQQITKSG